jgi:maleylacetoacetate isomerase
MDSTPSTPPLPLLFSYWRSSCSYRVRLALYLKEIPFEYRVVNLIKDGGQQLSEEYARVNPMKAVPALVIDGRTLTQSTAIVEYLEDTRPGPRPLFPADPYLRAKVREICCIIACDIQPVQNLKVLKGVAALVPPAPAPAEGEAAGPDPKEAAKQTWARNCMVAGFTALEVQLRGCAGTYCVGDDVTLADCFLAPQVYNAERFKVDLAPFPTLLRVFKNASELDAFKRAHPSAQPDAE